MRVAFLATVLVAILANLVSADDDLRNCDSKCNDEFFVHPVCALSTRKGLPHYVRFPNACELKITNCKYPTDSKYLQYFISVNIIALYLIACFFFFDFTFLEYQRVQRSFCKFDVDIY